MTEQWYHLFPMLVFVPMEVEGSEGLTWSWVEVDSEQETNETTEYIDGLCAKMRARAVGIYPWRLLPGNESILERMRQEHGPDRAEPKLIDAFARGYMDSLNIEYRLETTAIATQARERLKDLFLELGENEELGLLTEAYIWGRECGKGMLEHIQERS